MICITTVILECRTFIAIKGFVKTTDHRPTDHRPTAHLALAKRPLTNLTPDRLLSTYVKTEDQIPNMFCIL